MYNKISKKNTGFTLVEMLVAIAVFMTVMTAVIGAMLSVIDANRKSQAIKSVIDNLNFAIETISRDMRVAQNYSCSTDDPMPMNPDFSSGDCPSGGEAVQYQKSDTEYVQYRFEANPASGEGNLQRRICTPTPNDCPNTVDAWQSITAPTSTLQIDKMTFYVLGTGTKNNAYGDKNQPRVVITAEGMAGTKETVRTDFTLQTSISQRPLEQTN